MRQWHRCCMSTVFQNFCIPRMHHMIVIEGNGGFLKTRGMNLILTAECLQNIQKKCNKLFFKEFFAEFKLVHISQSYTTLNMKHNFLITQKRCFFENCGINSILLAECSLNNFFKFLHLLFKLLFTE